jgi:hypothetical protein
MCAAPAKGAGGGKRGATESRVVGSMGLEDEEEMVRHTTVVLVKVKVSIG